MSTIDVTIKLVLFSVINNSLWVLLTDEKLPSAEIEHNIPLDEKVKQLFKTTTNISLENQYVEQLYTVSSSTDTIDIVYYILVPVEETTEQKNTWVELQKIQKSLPSFSIIMYALQRMQWKIEYTNVVYSLLSEEFTLSELQKTYEAILRKPLDKRNFRKKILSLSFLKPTGKKRVGIARPAQMYQFRKRKPVFVNIFSS